MGMAASQARFLSLTARKTNVEWEGQQVNQQRTALANESANLYNQLTAIKVPTPPAVSDYTTTTYTFTTSDLKETSGKGNTAFSFSEINNVAGQNYVTLAYTKYFWEKAIDTMNSGTIFTDESGNKKINLTTGVSTSATEYEAKPDQLKTITCPKEVFENNDGTVKTDITIASMNFTFNGNDKITLKSDTTHEYSVKKLDDGKYQVTIVNDKNDDGKVKDNSGNYSVSFGGQYFAVTVNENGSYTLQIDGSTVDASNIVAKYYSTSGSGATFSNDYFGDEFTTATIDGVTKYNQNVLSYNLGDSTRVYYISAAENAKGSFSASYYVGEVSKKEFVEYPCYFETAENGRYKSISIMNSSGDLETFPLSVTSKQDEAAYDQAMLDYQYEQAKYEKQVKDINAKTEKIQQEDRTLELRLKQLDTEQNALKTEMDAVSKVIEDNIESTFKTFA